MFMEFPKKIEVAAVPGSLLKDDGCKTQKISFTYRQIQSDGMTENIAKSKENTNRSRVHPQQNRKQNFDET